MGALEFKPALADRGTKSIPIEIAELTELAQRILESREGLAVNLEEREGALNTIISVGTSAGGARAKALIAWNPKTNEVRSGQVQGPPGFGQWVLKFDGVRDRALGDSEGYGRIEYAYHLMAVEAGIEMSECRLYEEGGRAHFMTRRFDRSSAGGRIHMQSLCGLAHYDFNMAGAYGYEQAFGAILQLNLGYPALGEMFRRMVFNVAARNQDDHTRNIAFLMDKTGRWRLSPAFDVMWAYNPSGPWTNTHQMSIQGKRDGFKRSDLIGTARQFGVKNAEDIIDHVVRTIAQWPAYAARAGVPASRAGSIASTHRLSL
jgi:serine/threonine-protein kinase HipA